MLQRVALGRREIVAGTLPLQIPQDNLLGGYAYLLELRGRGEFLGLRYDHLRLHPNLHLDIRKVTVTHTQQEQTDEEERRSRALTSADIEALADALEKKLTDRFYNNLGKGLWSLMWKGCILAGLALAAYGAAKEHL